MPDLIELGFEWIINVTSYEVSEVGNITCDETLDIRYVIN
jgi:hypothetical protein